jgi:hypothetical protein
VASPPSTGIIFDQFPLQERATAIQSEVDNLNPIIVIFSAMCTYWAFGTKSEAYLRSVSPSEVSEATQQIMNTHKENEFTGFLNRWHVVIATFEASNTEIDCQVH